MKKTENKTISQEQLKDVAGGTGTLRCQVSFAPNTPPRGSSMSGWWFQCSRPQDMCDSCLCNGTENCVDGFHRADVVTSRGVTSPRVIHK